MGIRYQALHNWLAKVLGHDFQLNPMANDASFRRYFRVSAKGQTWIAMDAPPNLENCQPFVAIAQSFRQRGLYVPDIIAQDLQQGFLLLSDLGDRLFINELNEHNNNHWYAVALTALLQIHACKEVMGWQLPNFNQSLLEEELRLFQTWFLKRHLNLELPNAQLQQLSIMFASIAEAIKEQPLVCVHRDYHSRNLLCIAEDQVGILDFQDAVWGPVTYDAVSLLRDGYIDWPEERVEAWVKGFHQGLIEEKLIPSYIKAMQFQRWFDWMGVQRHLKIIFIYARKFHRDQDPRYLGYIPRAIRYLLNQCDRYSEFSALREYLLHPMAMTQDAA